MTEFILVAGMFTGARVWEGTAARLVPAGAGAHPVALSGLGPGADGDDDPVDLERHIADVLAVIDDVVASAGDGPAPEIVLVGHDYGMYPLLGAADRRARHIARIVAVDTGPAADGMPALAVVADAGLRDEVIALAGADGPVRPLPAPEPEQWQRWGSTDGLDDAALKHLTSLASPQPLATLLQPLKLTGASGALPVTGVLCQANGGSIGLLQQRVDFGDPVIGMLASPGISFFELATGHWPMLSRPGELADVLLRAAAGEGHRLTKPDADRPPAHLRPFPLDVPERTPERHGNIDLYVPEGGGPRPAVVFVHGGPVPAGVEPTPRDWTALRGYARYAAAEGVVGVLFDHRLHDTTDYARAADDVAAAVERVRSDPRVDADRIALWFFSGGGLLCADWLGAPPAWLRCLAASYPILVPLPGWGPVEDRFRPADALAGTGSLPLVLTRVGQEMPGIAATVEEFLTSAARHGTDIEIIDVPSGHHAFEGDPVTDEIRDALRAAMSAVIGRLTD
ncbi:alpha/beta hydrolase [Streptomyces sp. NPDC059783]|uniref:alpha/beta hydrolase n=1 Tax=Streptomyces sp. NPDC059783 TaxID=3346944 RepID=UPI00364BF13C